jgi:hypothetical protein
MKIPINTDILKKYNLSLEQFIVLLTGYFNVDCDKIQEELTEKGLVEKNLFHNYPPILSDNTKNFIAKIIVESDDKLLSCPIKDFEELAVTLQQFFPEGIKSGKTYSWRGNANEIAQKLRTLIVKYNFSFTYEEAMQAAEEYVSSFQPPYTYMHTLRNFILYTKKDENGHYEIDSQFMTIIENNREDNENNN